MEEEQVVARRRVVIVNAYGLHMRPAGKFVAPGEFLPVRGPGRFRGGEGEREEHPRHGGAGRRVRHDARPGSPGPRRRGGPRRPGRTRGRRVPHDRRGLFPGDRIPAVGTEPMFENAELGHKVDKADLRAGSAPGPRGPPGGATRAGRGRPLRRRDRHRRRRGGQVRDGQPAHGVDGRARHPDARDAGADRRGAATAPDVAILAGAAAARPDGHLLRRLVRPAAPRPRLRPHRPPRAGPGTRSDRRARTDAAPRGGPPREVLAAPVAGRPEGADQGARSRPAPALAGHQAGLEAVQALRRIPQGRRARPAPHGQRRRAVDTSSRGPTAGTAT